MISFSRTMLVTGEFLKGEFLRLRGILEDHIYAMEIQVDVRLPEGVIASIQGTMKRYTTPVCPKAVDVLQKAVGMSLREQGWISGVNREIGRQGCQHFAEILVECGRCLDPARMSHHIEETLKAEPSASTGEIAGSWVKTHPEVQGSCLARPKG
ncbi:MAG: hypothetical protein H6Q44_1346 [Deltaproteobacteria bacterium]|jgi:hypothetical protein|nr:hypothetical protein [Deltaproteobacteria bacterium]